MNPLSKRIIKDNYDNLGGELYDKRYKNEQSLKYDMAILLTLPRHSEIVFDNGCGTGLFLERLDSIAIGLDLTSSFLRVAKTRLKKVHHLILGDAEHLPLRFGIFDVSYAITLIQNIPNRKISLEELKRVTEKGGRILVTALKVAFTRDSFTGLLVDAGIQKHEIIGDGGTHDWIAFAEV